MVGNLVVHDDVTGLINNYHFDEISSHILDVVASEISLTGKITGVVENQICSQEYIVFYENGNRRRFIIKSYVKKKDY